MNIIETKLSGTYILEPDILKDERGSFLKTFNTDIFKKNNLRTDFKESYYSTSNRDVIRGMHFQAPPADHAKLIYVTYGIIQDLILDIRKGSPTYGEYISVNLDAENGKIFYVPSGLAHGFKSLQDGSVVTYLQTSVYSRENDCGINPNSFGFDWDISNPVISQRDQALPFFKEFKTPFTYGETK